MDTVKPKHWNPNFCLKLGLWVVLLEPSNELKAQRDPIAHLAASRTPFMTGGHVNKRTG